mgnify:CR=1 FL=1
MIPLIYLCRREEFATFPSEMRRLTLGLALLHSTCLIRTGMVIDLPYMGSILQWPF